MKTRYLYALLLTALTTFQPLLAHADDDDRRYRPGSGNLEWRLGSARGGSHEIYYRYSNDRQWRRAPGAAYDVGDGWVIGTDRRNGGYGIYRWNGRDWQRMPGAAVRIGGSYDRPWVVNDRGERFAWTGNAWREEWRNDRNDRRRDDRRADDRWDNGHHNSWRNDRRR